MITPQQRDRMMQVFLAQARGPRRNGDLLRESFDLMLQMRARRDGEPGRAPVQNSLIEMLSTVASALERLGITYAITGSVASSVHGEPFMSQDVDLVLLADGGQATALANELSPRFYVPADMLAEAAKRNALANAIDNKTGLKVDLSFIAPEGYLKSCLDRRVRKPIGGSEAQYWFVTQEDIILMKLLWRKDTRSTKQWENALSVARVKGTRMDWAYLFDKARELGIEDDLILLRDEAGI